MAVFSQILKNVRSPFEGQAAIAILLFHFILVYVRGTVIGHRCRLYDDVLCIAAGGDRLKHFLRRGHRDYVYKGRRLERGRACDQCNGCTAPGGVLRERISHFPVE